MALLGKDALLRKRGLKREEIHIGPLDGSVRMRELSVSERLDASKRFGSLDEADAGSQMRAILGLVARSLCNDDDSPMFPTDAEQDEMVTAFLDMSSASVQELMDECLRLNGLGKYTKEALKEAVGNSSEIPTASSV